MQSKVNFTVVGIFVITLMVFLFAAIIWLTSVGHGKGYRTYLVYLRDDVTGLSVESPVRFNGVKVGYVNAIHLDPTNPRLVKLTLGIEPHIPITTSTYAILNAHGVTGITYLNLKAETESAPLLVAAPGQRYPVIPARPSLLMQLKTALPEMTADMRNLSSSIGEVLDDNNRQSIKDSLHNIAIITKVMADNSTHFTQTLHSLDNVLANISEASNQLPKTISQLNKTLGSGQVALSNFSDQLLPNAQQATMQLSRVTMKMEHFMNELERDPSMLVRGRQPASLGPGEK